MMVEFTNGDLEAPVTMYSKEAGHEIETSIERELHKFIIYLQRRSKEPIAGFTNNLTIFNTKLHGLVVAFIKNLKYEGLPPIDINTPILDVLGFFNLEALLLSKLQQQLGSRMIHFAHILEHMNTLGLRVDVDAHMLVKMIRNYAMSVPIQHLQTWIGDLPDEKGQPGEHLFAFSTYPVVGILDSCFYGALTWAFNGTIILELHTQYLSLNDERIPFGQMIADVYAERLSLGPRVPNEYSVELQQILDYCMMEPLHLIKKELERKRMSLIRRDQYIFPVYMLPKCRLPSNLHGHPDHSFAPIHISCNYFLEYVFKECDMATLVVSAIKDYLPGRLWNFNKRGWLVRLMAEYDIPEILRFNKEWKEGIKWIFQFALQYVFRCNVVIIEQVILKVILRYIELYAEHGHNILTLQLWKRQIVHILIQLLDGDSYPPIQHVISELKTMFNPVSSIKDVHPQSVLNLFSEFCSQTALFANMPLKELESLRYQNDMWDIMYIVSSVFPGTEIDHDSYKITEIPRLGFALFPTENEAEADVFYEDYKVIITRLREEGLHV